MLIDLSQSINRSKFAAPPPGDSVEPRYNQEQGLLDVLDKSATVNCPARNRDRATSEVRAP